MGTSKINRRRFIATAAGAGAALAGAATLGKPRKAVAANEKILMGIIGSGGRGRNIMRTCRRLDPAVEFIAVCDVYEPRRAAGLKDAGGKPKVFIDHRNLLEMKEIDAVIIATPEHLHAPHLMDAVAARKDVYLEKPMSHSIEEGHEMVKAVRNTDRIVQIGMQRRSAPMCIEAKRLVDDGALGEVNLVRAQWFWHQSPLDKNATFEGQFDWERFLGPAPKRPVEPIRALRWRFFWDYAGGIVTDQGTHLMDVVQWFMGKGTPRSAVMQGGSYRLGHETPDVFSASYEYGGFTASWMCTYNNSFENGWKILFHGSKGTLVIDGTGYRVYAEPWREKRYREPTRVSKGALPTSPHVKNWLECLRTRKEPNAPVEVGHAAVAGPHLANVAFRNRAVAKLNEACTKVTI